MVGIVLRVVKPGVEQSLPVAWQTDLPLSVLRQWGPMVILSTWTIAPGVLGLERAGLRLYVFDNRIYGHTFNRGL